MVIARQKEQVAAQAQKATAAAGEKATRRKQRRDLILAAGRKSGKTT